MKELTEKQELFVKTNMICSICGKFIEHKQEYEVTKTQRNTIIAVHKECI